MHEERALGVATRDKPSLAHRSTMMSSGNFFKTLSMFGYRKN